MQPALSLEQEVAKAKWPRTGKLLRRQNPDSDIFYREFVHVNSQFAETLREHFSQKGNLIDLIRKLEERQNLYVGEDALKNYASGRTNRVQLQTYNTIASLLNEKHGTSLEQKALPDLCSGFYVWTLLGWYFDRVDKRTKALESPMPVAAEIFLAELAQADEGIAALSRGTKEKRHAAKCFVRDVLTGRGGLMPYSIFRQHELDVIASLRVYQNAVTPLQLRTVFEGADRRTETVNGCKASAFLGPSLEAGLNALADQARRANPTPYSYDGHNTPPGIDYYAGDWIIHDNQTQGLGKVMASGVKKAKEAHRFGQSHKEYEYEIGVEFANEHGKVRPFIVRPKS